jgi:ubiquinone/menaquinone biosynthesis C-methylase UbiE
MKDRFSSGSQLYQLARPSYPASLIQEILKHVATPQFAWDCGAGSGQLTQLLAPYFDAVVAKDISTQQLQHAPYFENVSYQVQSAEHTSFAEQSFDLITVAQAIHWFDFDGFYAEVLRTLRPEGILAVIGYGLIQLQQPELQGCIERLYFKTLTGYWDAERRYIDEAYQTIPFPFEEIATSELSMSFQWSAAQLLDYLNTWSALKHYRAKNSDDPLYEFKAFFAVDDHPNQVFELKFPIFLRLGRLPVSAH